MASSEVSSPGMLRSRTSTVGLWLSTHPSAASASAASPMTAKSYSTPKVLLDPEQQHQNARGRTE